MPRGRPAPDGIPDHEFWRRMNGQIARRGRCPTDRELKDDGEHTLRHEIRRRGGLKLLASRYGLVRSQRYMWDEESALAAWAEARAATGREVPPKGWFITAGKAGALSYLRRRSAGGAGLAGLYETAQWVRDHSSDLSSVR